MNLKTLFLGLGFCGICASTTSTKTQTGLREWLVQMHKNQLEMLKIDWGRPGFCGEYDRDYDPLTRSCGKRGKLIQRRYRD